MNTNNEIINELVEVKFDKDDTFLKIAETLTRMGVPSFKNKTLYQSCHILFKRGKYYIVHFKELFKLDGRTTDISEEDINRRNSIVQLLNEWNLCHPVDENILDSGMPQSRLMIIPYRDKKDWNLKAKYCIGNT